MRRVLNVVSVGFGFLLAVIMRPVTRNGYKAAAKSGVLVFGDA